MSAINGPDEQPHTEQYPEAQQDNNAIDSRSEYDQSYEPEREFVLMPLFRRIGDILGLRRSHEPEYIYEPEHTSAPQEPVLRTIEPQEEIVLPETAIQYSEPQLPAETEVLRETAPIVDQQQHHEKVPAQDEQDTLQIRSDVPPHISEPVVHESATELDEPRSEPIRIEPQQTPAAVPSVSEEAAYEPLVSARSEAPEAEVSESASEEWPAPPVQAAARPVQPSRKRSPDEIRQLVAPLREAAVKITAIVSQAADWLRAKEEEFLRSAEVIGAEAKREQENLLSSRSQLRSPAEASVVSSTLHNELPGVQRELSWRERGDDSAGQHEPLPMPIQFIAKPDRPSTPPTVPFWKRIDWAAEFTPKRVAVLGGLVMAVLLVLGISFARRPASSVLPEQQTRAIEPGGVTVTAHPVAPPVPPQVLRKTSVSERPSSAPQHRSRRASAEAYDDEPDVVVHHYDTAKKPSPVKQTTVAGVRHYSDM